MSRTSQERPGTWARRRLQVTRRIAVPFVWIEWLSEWGAYWLSEWAFLRILEYVGRLGVLVAAVSYIGGADERSKQQQYQAWQVINGSEGKPGGARSYALQDLNQDGISLQKLNLESADLNQVQLEGADLYSVNLKGASLRGANLRGAHLADANLNRALMYEARLDNADLRGARVIVTDLTGAVLTGTSLRGAWLVSAVLSYADLRGANFLGGFEDTSVGKYGTVGTNFWKTIVLSSDLSNADLDRANLAEVSFYDATFRAASLVAADFSHSQIHAGRFWAADLRQAKFVGATLSPLATEDLNNLLKQYDSGTSTSGCQGCEYVDFNYADLREANFEGVTLGSVVFTSADLRGTRWKDVRGWRSIKSLRGANVYGVVDPPEGFLTWAVSEMGAVVEANDDKWHARRQEQSRESNFSFLENEVHTSIQYRTDLRARQ